MDYTKIPSAEIVNKTIAALKERNFLPEVVDTKEQALARLKELIPAGAEVMTGASTTLNEIGFTDYLKSGQHPWKNLKEAIANEKDPAKQSELRRQSILSQYFLGSIHAVTEDGVILVASASGSQIPSYVFASPNVVWVVGTHKITANTDESMKRLREYVFPLEDARMKAATEGKSGSSINKVLFFEREPAYLGRKLHLIFVNEKLGF